MSLQRPALARWLRSRGFAFAGYLAGAVADRRRALGGLRQHWVVAVAVLPVCLPERAGQAVRSVRQGPAEEQRMQPRVVAHRNEERLQLPRCRALRTPEWWKELVETSVLAPPLRGLQTHDEARQPGLHRSAFAQRARPY